MLRVTSNVAVRFIPAAIVAAAFSLGMVVFAVPAVVQEAPTFELWDFGVVPRPAMQGVLLQMGPIQDELKMTDAQKKEQAAISERFVQKFQQARSSAKDRAKFREIRIALAKEEDAAILANLKPE